MKKNNLIITILLCIFLIMQTTFAITIELVKTNPSPIIAADYADITLRFINPIISNKDNNIKNNIIINIEKTDYIMPIDNQIKISKMNSGETITRTFRVFFSEDLEQGYINIPVMISIDGIKTKTDIKVFIEDSKRMPQIMLGQIQTTPNELLQDSDNNKLKIKLQNLGDKSAELIKAELIPLTDEITPSYSYSFEDSLSSIEGGSQGEVEFTIDVKENIQQEIPAQLKLRYRAQKAIGNTYETFDKIINFTIPITPAPYLVVEKVEQLTDFKIGTTENKLKITIKNQGTEDAKEVRVRVVPDISYPLIFEETTEYVSAKIKAGETASVLFKLEITKDGQVRDYNSIVILESLVEDSRYSREDTMSITTKEGNKTDKSTYGYIIVGAIIFVSIILGINTYRSRNKSKK